jgi:hypothetical protein
LPITSAGRFSPLGPRGIVSLPAEPQRGALLKVDDDHYEHQSDYDPKRNVAPNPFVNFFVEDRHGDQYATAKSIGPPGKNSNCDTTEFSNLPL